MAGKVHGSNPSIGVIRLNELRGKVRLTSVNGSVSIVENETTNTIDLSAGSNGVISPEVACKSDVFVGAAVYFNTTTSQFENAFRDGTLEQASVKGIVESKPTATTCH